MRPRQRFPRSCRLTARRQFRAVYDGGRKASCRSFTMFGLPNNEGRCRLGLTATRKIGGAVRRNRAKRVLREVFRRNRERLDMPIDLVVNAHPAILDTPTSVVERDFIACFATLARRLRS